MDKYLYWSEDIVIKNHRNRLISLRINKELKDIPTRSNMLNYTINSTALDIVSLIDGTRTYDMIITELSEKYEENKGSIKEKVNVFLENMVETYNLKINEQINAENRNITVINQNVMYPLAASIELTNKCNIRCIHCYGDFGEIKGVDMSLESAKQLLTDLKKIGVRMIELTGGEATANPYIEDILIHAASLKFDQVSLLTNGVSMSDRLKDIIIQNKSKILVQIDLHGLTDEYLAWFTKVQNTLTKIKNNITKLANEGVRMRVVTVLTRRNIYDIEEIASWVYNLGIKNYAVSPVISLGRALNLESDLQLNQEDYIYLNGVLEKIQDKYPGLMATNNQDRSDKKNCGCLSTHIVISSSGDIKMCTMDSEEYGNNSIGNVFEKNIQEIYEEYSDYVDKFFNMSAPTFDSNECKECEHKEFCSNCVLRGFIRAKEMNEKCLWYSNIVDKDIKNQLGSKVLAN